MNQEDKFSKETKYLSKKIRNDWGDHCVEQRICKKQFRLKEKCPEVHMM